MGRRLVVARKARSDRAHSVRAIRRDLIPQLQLAGRLRAACALAGELSSANSLYRVHGPPGWQYVRHDSTNCEEAPCRCDQLGLRSREIANLLSMGLMGETIRAATATSLVPRRASSRWAPVSRTRGADHPRTEWSSVNAIVNCRPISYLLSFRGVERKRDHEEPAVLP